MKKSEGRTFSVEEGPKGLYVVIHYNDGKELFMQGDDHYQFMEELERAEATGDERLVEMMFGVGSDYHDIAEYPEGMEKAFQKAKRESCCCGATKSSPCACMKKGVMNCSKSDPKCPCYKDKDLKKAVEKKRFINYPTCANSFCVARVDSEGQYCESHQGMAKAFAVGWNVVKSR